MMTRRDFLAASGAAAALGYAPAGGAPPIPSGSASSR